MLQASFALQRLSNTLNALMNAAPGLAKARLPLEAFRRVFAPALAEPYNPTPAITELSAQIPSADGSAEATFARDIAGRLASELQMLREGSRPAGHLLTQGIRWEFEGALALRTRRLPEFLRYTGGPSNALSPCDANGECGPGGDRA
jgi:hypothetical protein